jgi:flagellar motor switch protein FliN
MTDKTAPGAGKPADTAEPANLDMLMDVSLQVAVELGRTRMTVRQLLDLQNGSVIELDRMAGDVVDVYINDRLLARGEVVVVDDKFGVRVTELISPLKGPGDV